MLKEGDRGTAVLVLQRSLRMKCCDPGGIDGVFGPNCTNAVKRFQRLSGLGETGIYGGFTEVFMLMEILVIQKQLNELGYDTGGMDGKAGPKTYNSLLAFQSANGLTADGMVGPMTWRLLSDGASGGGVSGTSGLPLNSGSRGSKVLCVQYACKILCYSPGAIDGIYGQRTKDAVRRFQQGAGLAADGIVGTATWNKLIEKIKVIQTALQAKGYSVITDGLASNELYDTIVEFQRDNGLATDGMCGPATMEKLTGSASGGGIVLPMKEGMSGGGILCLQQALRIAIINCPLNSTFDANTKACVIRYQTRYGLSTDGIVGTKTWESLRTLVRQYQVALDNKGYDVGGIDGIAGDKTYSAVLKFQGDHGLTVDGMCGTQTQIALFGAAQPTGVTGTVSVTLKNGSSGSLTRYLQVMLNKMGYSLSVDGIFGPNMETAVKNFQSSKGLTADGIVGNNTWKQLFASYSINVPGTGVEKFLNVAKYELQIGFHEDNGNNITPYGIWGGYNEAEWCGLFVSWCAHYAGIENTIVPHYGYTPSGAAWYKQKNKYHKRGSGYTPKPGDTIFFYSASDGRIRHTGIVTHATSSYVYTIEGNSSNGVRERTYSLTDSYIDGYGDNGGAPSVSDYTDNAPTHIKDLVPFIRELEDISTENGYSIRDTACNVLDYMRQYAYGDSADESNFEWSVAVRVHPYGYYTAVRNTMPAKKRDWVHPYIVASSKRPPLQAGGNGEIDVPHFCVTTEAYVLGNYRTSLISPHFCGWGGDLASAAHDMTLNLSLEATANADAERVVCIGTRFNPSDVPSDADAIKVAEMIVTNINNNNAHAVSDAISAYYNSNEVNRRAHHFIRDFGIQDTAGATYETIKVKIGLMMASTMIWGTKGKLSDGTEAPILYRNALYHAFAKWCVDNR